MLLWLIREAGPAFAGNGAAKRASRGADSSRSAVAFRKGIALRAAGRSYEEMVEALRSDPETAEWCREKGDANGGRELRRIWDKAAGHEWLAHCQRNSEGNLRSNLANALVALREAPELQELFSYDEMLRAPLLMKSVPGAGAPDPIGAAPSDLPRPVRDVDVTAVQEWLQRAGLSTVSKDTTHQAVDLCASERAFHPVRQYLNGLRWDGERRLLGWLNAYLGVDHGKYATGIGTMFMIAMVARVFEPGLQGGLHAGAGRAAGRTQVYSVRDPRRPLVLRQSAGHPRRQGRVAASQRKVADRDRRAIRAGQGRGRGAESIHHPRRGTIPPELRPKRGHRAAPVRLHRHNEQGGVSAR